MKFSTVKFAELDEMKPLVKLGITLPPLHDMQTAKKCVENKKIEWPKVSEENKNRFYNLSTLNELKEAFPDVYKLCASIDTFALAQINIPFRMSMANQRMRNLALIAFEHKRLKNISIVDVLKEFNSKKQRRVQLY